MKDKRYDKNDHNYDEGDYKMTDNSKNNLKNHYYRSP